MDKAANEIMDIEGIQSHLHALRQLYGLLQNDEDGMPRVTAETLDNKGKLLLKKLLDSATERVFEVHSQIIAREVDASPANSSLKVDGIGKQESVVVEAPNLIFSACESENRRKRCRICQRPKTVKHFKHSRRVKFTDNGSQSSIRVTPSQDKPSNQVSHIWQSDDQGEGFRSLNTQFCFPSGSNEREDKSGVFLSGIGSIVSSSANRTVPEFVKTKARHDEHIHETVGDNYLSKQVSEAIKQIELCISTLQLEAKYESGNAIADKFLQLDVPSAVRQTQGLIPSFVNEPNSSDHDIAHKKTPDSKGYRFMERQKGTANSLSVPLNLNTWKIKSPRPTMQFIENKKGLESHHKTMRQTRLGSEHSQLTETRKLDKDVIRYGNHGKRRYIMQQGSGATTSSSYSSLRSKQRQRSSYGSSSSTEEGDYSVSGQSSYLKYSDGSINSSSCSDSGPYRSRRITRSRYMTDSSSGENEVYSSSSSSSSLPSSSSASSFQQRSCSTRRGESESETSSQLDSSSTHSVDSSSKTSSPVRVHKSANSKKTKKTQVGRWKKLKDKLGIIFHHHHHHHHHHNDNKKVQNTSSYNITKVNHKEPALKLQGKIPNSQRKYEAFEEQAMQKVGKNKQGSNFQTLVRGLRHARHLKKPKLPKHGGLPSKKGTHGNKKVVKASHWWQLLRHHGKLKKPPVLLDSKAKKKLGKDFSKMKG
ncbi:unnamed protein product [Cuscuta campestris]|uniref:DUF3741 domain-containing protein n=1 Tax=Cuscuta campestris TaxID=132261 RepID=A0A484M189_9ASTE|nr:unnamed protein product [Cuscuta campestris]